MKTMFGTRNVAELSDKYGVKRFVMISTDKAVNPTSVMGATKRVAEMLIQLLARKSKRSSVQSGLGTSWGVGAV